MYRFSRALYLELKDLVDPHPDTISVTEARRRVLDAAQATVERLASDPDIPSVAETVPGFDLASWHGLLGPKGLPPAILERVNREINRTLRSPDVAERMQADGVTPSPGTPEDLRARLQREVPMWKQVVARAQIKLE